MKKLFAVLFAFAACLTLCSCTQNTNIEDLITLPETDAPKQRVLDKLIEVEADDVALICALRGEHQNAISFYDINGDGVDEVIVMYRSYKAHPNMGDAANIHIFKYQNGVLTSLFDIMGAGSEIDKLTIADFNGDGLCELVVGYISAYDSNTKMFYVYELDFVNKISNNTVSRRYSEFITVDMTGDGDTDLVSVTYKALGNVASASLFTYSREKFCVVENPVTVMLSYSRSMYTMLPFTAGNGKNAVIVSARYGTMLMTHELLVWDADKNVMVNASRTPGGEHGTVSFMNNNYVSLGDYVPCDIDGDDELEIPICNFHDEDEASKALTSWQEALLYLYGWYNFDGTELTHDFDAYINSERGYLFIIRDTEAFAKVKAYLNYNNDLYFYYVPNDNNTFPIFGIDSRTLLFSVISSEEPIKNDETHTFLYYSEAKDIYYTLVKNELTGEQAQYMPDESLLINAFLPAAVTVGN